MKKNYRAWQINPAGFPEQKTVTDQLDFLIGFAVLAPSGHNAQPWKFYAQGNTITVSADMTRSLPASDVNGRQLYISIGCAIENLLIAAEHYGFEYVITYFTKETIIARIVFSRIRKYASEKENLISAILHRHTNRNPYDTRMPEKEFLEKVKARATNDMEIHLVSEQSQKDKISDIASEALIAEMDDKNFRLELSQYLKPNTTHSSIGMPGAGFGIPTPLSFIAPFFIKYVNVNRLSRKADQTLLKQHTQVIGVIATREDNQKSWVMVGQVYERIAIEAETEHIKTHPLAASVEAITCRQKLQNALQTSYYPQFFFRMGYTDLSAPISPRLV